MYHYSTSGEISVVGIHLLRTATMAIVLQGIICGIDAHYYQSFQILIWNISYYNVSGGGDEHYGVEAFSYYIKSLLLNFIMVGFLGIVSLPLCFLFQSSEAVAKLAATERHIESLESSITNAISAIAIDPKLRASAIKDENTNVMTRSVISKVPIILLKKLWSTCNSIPIFLVPEEYLFKLASNTTPTQQLDVRRELGGIFIQVLRDPGLFI